ncbi:MAG: LytTR family transcriptional regulator [Firmicutes bacterium]|nr:LytTR family transcriptional regulator [Bacillota bacterium]
MKIRLAVSEERLEELTGQLMEKGIEIDDSADLVLSEAESFTGFLSVRGAEDGGKRHVRTEDIVFIESYGHSVEVHCMEGTYQTADRLYQLQTLLDPKQFIRISNSVIVSRAQIKDIRPTLSQKFILTMKDGSRVDVTRSYYSEFKRAIGI